MIKRWRTGLFLFAIGAIGVYFEPTHCAQAWLCGEAFFDCRPTSWWRNELEQWECLLTNHGNVELRRLRRKQNWIGGIREKWLAHKVQDRINRDVLTARPSLLSGDANAENVLRELVDDASPNVR